MNRSIISLLFCAIVATFFPLESLFAQGTTFTYQGRLNDSGGAANGSYDLTFALFNTNVNGIALAGPLTNSAVAVSNGLFTVTLDFSNRFDGTPRWLEIGVRTNNAAGFTTLSPRQQLTPTPYAIFANGASNLSGTLPASQLAGTLPASAFAGYTNTVALTNGGNLFSGTFNGLFNGAFFGNGGGMTNVNVTNLTGVLANNQLPANIAFVNSNQTFSGANNFTNFNNSFRGSFFGNGLVGWIPTNGTAIQAVVDTGYLVTNSQQVTVTLPLSANPGDIVRISGPGGWLVAQNANQAVVGNFSGYSSSSWTIGGASTTLAWTAMAASADGTKMAATVFGGGIYVSLDSGRTWNATGATARQYEGIASSADGSKLATVVNNDVIYTSTNSGSSWQQRTSGLPASAAWTAIASSADGTKLVAVGGSGIYVSANSGASWSGTQGGSGWTSAASSVDGTRMAAAAGTIYVSANGGSSWSATSGSGSHVASSGDGTKLVSAGSGGIYTSTDSGNTWTHRTTGLPGSAAWSSVASSSDGNLLAATVNGGVIYTSVNGGATWTQQAGAPGAAWSAITSSANGTGLAAAINSTTSGGIYTMQASTVSLTTIGTAGGIAGGQGAVELQYLGNNRFMPISFAGNIWAY